MRRLLAGEDEVVASVRHHLGDGVTGEEIVAQKHGAQRREPRVMVVRRPMRKDGRSPRDAIAAELAQGDRAADAAEYHRLLVEPAPVR